MNEELLYNTVVDRLKREDLELTELTNNGIFYAPELYVAFILGKSIKVIDQEIFDNKSDWIRESNLGNGGPTDFSFKTDDLTFAFELKLRDTFHSYSSDITKLKKLDFDIHKYFIALVDTWETEKENDSRIKNLERKFPELKRISAFKSFNTKQNRYKKQVCCTIGFWKID